MSGTDPALRAEASRWLAAAADDLRVVELTLAQLPPLTGPAAYHAQQAAEKMLKALLMLQRKSVPRTHDLVLLLDLLGPLPDLPDAAAETVAALTPWATRTRYPDLDEAGEPSAAEIAEALPSLRLVEGIVARLLGP